MPWQVSPVRYRIKFRPPLLKLANQTLSFDTPMVMGVLNVTPDSFSDGGKYVDRAKALDHALEMIQYGAAIIDVGGESTRPGSVRPSVDEEIDRVAPMIEAIAKRSNVVISVDTSRPAVMNAAVSAGAQIVNDVRGLREPDAIAMCAKLKVAVVIMHMQGEPATMQKNPTYQQVGPEVKAYLLSQTQACLAAGISQESILWDPGFGFGKTFLHNQTLFNYLPTLAQGGYPLLVGVSRKSWVGHLLNEPDPLKRVSGSVALGLLACQKGAVILRVHDVKETCDALSILTQISGINSSNLVKN